MSCRARSLMGVMGPDRLAEVSITCPATRAITRSRRGVGLILASSNVDGRERRPVVSRPSGMSLPTAPRPGSGRILLPLLAALVIAAAGCADDSAPDVDVVTSPPPTSVGPEPTGEPSARPEAVTVRRTGGIAGRAEQVSVRPNGSWSYEDQRQWQPDSTGRLTDDQRQRLRSLLADPALPDEAGAPTQPPACADGFEYELATGQLTVRWTDCGGPGQPPAARAVVDLLIASTPL